MIESEAEYRQRARRWLAANLTPAASTSHRLGPADGQTESEWVARSRAIQAKLSEGGYAGITLPPELGGAGLDQRYQQIFDEESAGYELPPYFAGARGPTFYLLLACMSDAHQREHIPAILDGREVWCQLMSEPGAGSDLAGVVTRADRDGDEWVINGQKVWTTDAHFSEYGICLARTDFDVPKHAGLTMFFVSMDTPGVTARPLRQADGSAAFNEVFLDDVRIPAENVLGEVNQGWSTVRTWLVYEHGGMAKGDGGRGGEGPARPLLEGAMPDDLIAIARERDLLDRPVVRQDIVRTFVGHAVQTLLGHRIAAAMRDGRMPGHAGSIIRCGVTANTQRTSNLRTSLAGMNGIAWDASDVLAAGRARDFIEDRALSIRGGTTEIQRNAIGERVLGLPREPAVDVDIPFRDVRKNVVPPRGGNGQR